MLWQSNTCTNKKLSYRRETARCVVSVEILPNATQQCRNYLYDKSSKLWSWGGVMVGRCVINMCTQQWRIRVMGFKILKRFSWPWPRHFQGSFFIGRVGLAMVSQCTKFEISGFTHYEAMNGGAKCRKLGGLGRLWDTQGHGQCHHFIERIRLPIWL